MKKITEGKLKRSDYQQLNAIDPSYVNNLHEAYYKVADGLQPMIDALTDIVEVKPQFKDELIRFKKIQQTFYGSELDL